jgi:hypothetical protein
MQPVCTIGDLDSKASGYNNQYRVECQFISVFRRFCTIAKKSISFVMSVCLSIRPQGTNKPPTGELLCNMICEYFSKICRKFSSFFQFWQEQRVFNTKTYVPLVQYLTQFLIEWEIFQKKCCRVNQNAHFSSTTFFFRNPFRLWNMVKPGRPQITIW